VANRWTPAEIAQLKNLAARHSAAEIAEKLDRTVGGVTFKAHQINLTLLSRTAQQPDWQSISCPNAQQTD
jgi:hypothetical protein